MVVNGLLPGIDNWGSRVTTCNRQWRLSGYYLEWAMGVNGFKTTWNRLLC